MPEGPEVKVLSTQLDSILKEKKLITITIHNFNYLEKHSSIENHEQRIREFQIALKTDDYYLEGVFSHGKKFWFSFKTKPDDKIKRKDYFLVCHLGMTGTWTQTPSKYTHLSLTFDSQIIYFQDIRCFGSLNLCYQEELDQILSRLGLDILSPDMTEENFLKVMSAWAVKTKSKKSIAEMLLEQSLLAGIGNYLRADILYDAKIHPKKITKNLSEQELRNLYKSTKKIVNQAYMENGNTIKDYQNLSGHGGYQPLVYGRKICPQGKKIETLILSKRTLYWCPEIQNEQTIV